VGDYLVGNVDKRLSEVQEVSFNFLGALGFHLGVLQRHQVVMAMR
jgi:hypothetical protein